MLSVHQFGAAKDSFEFSSKEAEESGTPKNPTDRTNEQKQKRKKNINRYKY